MVIPVTHIFSPWNTSQKHELRPPSAGVQIPVPLFTSCVTLCRLLHLCASVSSSVKWSEITTPTSQSCQEDNIYKVLLIGTPTK